MSSEITIRKSTRVAALMLSLFALSGAALVAGTFYLTQPVIEDNERQQMLAQLGEVLTGVGYDSDLLAGQRWLDNPAVTGRAGPQPVYVAQAGADIAGTVFVVTAPNGYSGPIKMLVGIDAGGVVRGVRVISHRETPGLGDGIELRRSNWVRQFEGRSIAQSGADAWRVAKDGGVFDSLTGATVTSRAVVAAVRGVAEYYARYGHEHLQGKPRSEGDV